MDKTVFKKANASGADIYCPPEVKVIPLMTQRPILQGSTGEIPIGSPGIPTGPGV